MEEKIENQDEKEKGIINAEITEEMQKAYIDYAMSVIVARALPSVEDGLKPVHRRILYAMYLLGLQSNKQTRKCARIVGDVLGKFHPHGDTAVYYALVRMAQDFSLRYPLIYGQGNFGSMDGDKAAAMRYTEAKLSKISMELLEDIDKETVKLIPNFDNSIKEPTVLPAKLPNLLLNGASGIAVGMATNIPPHNLTEIVDTIVAIINKPDITIEKLMRIIKGPDFPTGGYVSGNMLELYKTGKGQVVIRGKTTIESIKKKQAIVITEIPYQINKSDLVKQIATLVQSKKLDVSDIRDESAKGKIRIVIELKRTGNPKFILNALYKYTRLQDKFNINMLALVKNQPRVLNLKQILELYIEYRKKIITKRTEFLLKKALNRKEIVEGLLIALKNIDLIISTIKKAKHATEALAVLQKKFKLTQKQAQAVLETRLQQLTSLEQEKLKREFIELKKKIAEYEKILGNIREVLSIIKREVNELKRKYGDQRRTYVLQKVNEISEKDLVQKKDVVITITDKDYCKRLDLKIYKEQKRGGRGVIGSGLATGDFVKQLLICSTHDYLLFFTTKGRVYWLKAHEIPSAERYSKGKALINLLSLKDEQITNVISVKKFEGFLIMATKKGHIKKMPYSVLSKPRKTGVRAINLPLDNSDSLIGTKTINKGEEVLLATKKGKAIRFNSDEVRTMGRASYGVIGIKLNSNDEVVGMEVLGDTESILTITKNGYGKRTAVEDYRKTSRAGKGVINLKVTQKTGNVITTISIGNKDSIIVTTAKGMVIRTNVKDIRIMGRVTQGVRIVRLQAGDNVTDLIKVADNGVGV